MPVFVDSLYVCVAHHSVPWGHVHTWDVTDTQRISAEARKEGRREEGESEWTGAGERSKQLDRLHIYAWTWRSRNGSVSTLQLKG
jgi:hypothetical protein